MKQRDWYREDHWYHVTPYENLESIAKKGLFPGTGGAIGAKNRYGKKNSRGRLFFSEPGAVYYWYSHLHDEGILPVILRIPFDLISDEMEPDEYGSWGQGAEAVFIRRGVPAKDIKVWTGDAWKPLSRWKQVYEDPEPEWWPVDLPKIESPGDYYWGGYGDE